MDIGAFRKEFPEFSNTEVYPTPMVQFWATFAEAQLSQHIWKTVWDTGVKLYVAHEIVLAGQSAKSGAQGGVPGTFGGIPNNKTVGSVSVGYDSGSNSSESDAYFWNLTTYGKQLFRLIRIYGAGCIQL